jgi:hypothetical protein
MVMEFFEPSSYYNRVTSKKAKHPIPKKQGV